MSLLARLSSAVRVPLVRRSISLRCVRLPLACAASSLHSSAFLSAAATPAKAASAGAAPVEPVKYTTNIAGLDVVPNGREVLMGLLKETLASIQEYNKEHGFEPPYNKQVAAWTSHRLKICEQNESHEAIEKAIWFGQIEELIEQAEDELDLLVTMNEEVKPWIVDEADRAEFLRVASPNFGETQEEFDRSMRNELPPQTDQEKAEIEAFWAPIDAEIREDQRREEEERQQRNKK